MENKNHLSGLDALRGFASFVIAFFWHYQSFGIKGSESPLYGIFPVFYDRGWIGVEFFFILSGFIFSYVYSDRINLNGKEELKSFVINRFSRLYPLHFFTLLIVAILVVAFGPFIFQANDLSYFFQNLLFVQYGWFSQTFSFNASTWSLSCEMLLYGLFFLICYKFYNKRIFLYLTLIILGLFLKSSNLNAPILNVSMGRAFVCFPLGCLVYEITKISFSNAFLFKAVLLVIVSISIGFPFLFSWKSYGDWEFIFIFILFPSVITLFSKSKTIINFTDNSFCRYLGNLSFTIYLAHYPIQYLIWILNTKLSLDINFRSEKTFLSYAIITIVISTIIW